MDGYEIVYGDDGQPIQQNGEILIANIQTGCTTFASIVGPTPVLEVEETPQQPVYAAASHENELFEEEQASNMIQEHEFPIYNVIGASQEKIINKHSFETVDTEGDKSQQSAKWGTNETKFLLNLVPILLAEVGPLKKFRKKKCMWEFIAAKIVEKFNFEVCGRQVETRYRCILKRTKKAIDSNNTSGSSREDPEYEEEIRRIVGIDDSICPVVLMGPGRRTTKEDVLTNTRTTSISSEEDPTEQTGVVDTSSSSSPSSSQPLPSTSTQPRRKTPTQRFFEKFMEAKISKDKQFLELKKKELEMKKAEKERKEELRLKRWEEKDRERKHRYEAREQLRQIRKQERHEAKLALLRKVVERK